MVLEVVLVLSLAVAADAPETTAAVTYCRDIAPIFQRSCQECHRPGEVAPMPLLTYEDARPWARSIKKFLKTREMPPWHADPRYGKFANDPRLGAEDIEKIVAWVDAGAPKGDPADLPPPRKFLDGWIIDKPDVVLSMPREFKVPAEGEVPYQYFAVPTNFKEDRWVQAAEVRPGNREVVHHIIVFIRNPDGESRRRSFWARHLCGTAPGEGPDVFPPGTGKLVPAGSILIFQVHYTPNGEPTTDRSKVGLVFARKPVKQVHVRAATNHRFRIPAGAGNHEVKSEYAFKQDSTLLGLMPHMHLRGKSFRYELDYPGGKTETILSVPRWDFNWQHHYQLAEPLKVPQGATLRCTAHFDNSKNNAANPDPTKTITWGDQTWEEMMIGFVTFTRDEDPTVVPSTASGGAEAKF